MGSVLRPSAPPPLPWATPGFNRFSPEPKLERSFTPGAKRTGPVRPVLPALRLQRLAAQSAEPESRAPGVAVAAGAGAAGTQTKPGGSAQWRRRMWLRWWPRWQRTRMPLTRQVRTRAERELSGSSPGRSRSWSWSGAGRAGALSVRPPPPLPPRRPPAPREGARRRLHPPPPAPRAPSFFHPSSRLPGSSVAARGRGRRLRDPLPRGWHRLRDRGFQVQLRPGKSEGDCYSRERVPF